MKCPVCSEEMAAGDTTSMYTCSGSTWSPHDQISYQSNDEIYRTTSPVMVQWFRENGYAINFAGQGYEIRQKKGVLSRLFHK